MLLSDPNSTPESRAKSQPETEPSGLGGDSDDAGVFFVGSPTLEASDIVSKARDHNDFGNLDFPVDQLHQRAEEYAEQVFNNVHAITGLVPKLITGLDAMNHALEAEPDLRNIPAVLMAPQAFEVRYRAQMLRDQVQALRGMEAVEWDAPVASMPISGIVYHGLADSLDQTKVGSTGRDFTARTALDGVRKLFEPYDSEGIVLIDDRATNNYDYLIAMARPFVMKGVMIRAYIVGHTAGEKYSDSKGQVYSKAPGVDQDGKVQPGQVPIYSFAFRYANGDDRMFGRGTPADEFADLGYFGNSGHSIIRDYVGRDTFGETSTAAALPVLREALIFLEGVSRSAQETYGRGDFGPLLDIGVKINNPDRLVQIFEGNSRLGKAFTINDLHDLFKNRGNETVLTIPGVPDFNPEVLEEFRAPMLWPGTPEERSFIDWISHEHHGSSEKQEAYGRWSAFSARMLTTTAAYLRDIEEITNAEVPVSVLGFYGVPKIMELFSTPTRRSMKALDYIDELVEIARATGAERYGGSAPLPMRDLFTGSRVDAGETFPDVSNLQPKQWW